MVRVDVGKVASERGRVRARQGSLSARTSGSDEPAAGDLPDDRPWRHVRDDSVPEGDRGGSQRGESLTKPRGFGGQRGHDVAVDPGEALDRLDT